LSSLDIPRFAVDLRPERSRVVLAVSGELDIATVGEVKATLEDLRATGWEDIAVDLRAVSFIDSCGLGLLISANERARAEGWRLSLLDGAGALERMLEVTGLSSRFRYA
jgi:anti-anti-sigma factor